MKFPEKSRTGLLRRILPAESIGIFGRLPTGMSGDPVKVGIAAGTCRQCRDYRARVLPLGAQAVPGVAGFRLPVELLQREYNDQQAQQPRHACTRAVVPMGEAIDAPGRPWQAVEGVRWGLRNFEKGSAARVA
jgi:hypothetical protein